MRSLLLRVIVCVSLVVFGCDVIAAKSTNSIAPSQPIAAPIASQGEATNSSTAIPLTTPAPISAIALTPSPPNFDVKAYILLDANSGYMLASKNVDTHLPPASITKLTSLYIIADALRSGRLHMNDLVTISANAWRMGGSKMFIKVGAQISVQELINGIVIASGNDATVAMAEHIAGSETAFVAIMNQVAARLGMKDTHYGDSNGLPAQDHYSSARDIATLARDWIFNFPEYYPWFKQQWIVFNGIKQPNRNRLLWRDPSVDGMKTGHTNDAGYCLVASAVRNGMRLISVVLGAPSENARNTYSEALLNYGFRFYESHLLYKGGTQLTKSRVWMGKGNMVPLGIERDLYATVPAGQYGKLSANIALNKFIEAPLKKGQVCGNVNVLLNNNVIMTQPLVALQDVAPTGIFGRMVDRIVLLFSH